MVSNWIASDNLEPFLTTLGWVVGYSYDDDDKAIINEDWLETGGIVSFEFAGAQHAKITFESDRTANLVKIAVEAPDELEPQIELAIAIFQHFQLRGRRGK